MLNYFKLNSNKSKKTKLQRRTYRIAGLCGNLRTSLGSSARSGAQPAGLYSVAGLMGWFRSTTGGRGVRR